jgi:hypothetical protein
MAVRSQMWPGEVSMLEEGAWINRFTNEPSTCWPPTFEAKPDQ